MQFTLLLTVLAGGVAMTGCAPAVAIHPLYTSQDLVSDLPLEGAWESGDGEVWHIQKSGDGYAVDSSRGSKYSVHLLRLNEYEFLDVTSKSDPEVGVAGHLFGKIRMQDGQLYISSIDEAWLKQMMDAGAGPQSTIGEGNQVVVTASTSDLQKFILLHAADPDAWDDDDDDGLHRLR
jgi:hypothetical protein